MRIKLFKLIMRVKMFLAGCSSLGAVETGYLTATKVFQNQELMEKFCGFGNHCVDVLNSPFATVPGLNIPIVSIGFAAYLMVAALSFLPNSKTIPGKNVLDWRNEVILMTTTAMATFSAYFMYLLAAVLKQGCNFCIISAVLSAAMAIAALKGNLVPNRTKATVLSSISVLITAVASIFLFTVTKQDVSIASTAPAAQYLMNESEMSLKSPPGITTTSSQKALDLSKRLASLDAKMYGAYWCSHCYNQKQEMGKEAFSAIPYIECDKKGMNNQYSLCREKKVPGYPTWEIKGELYPGEKTLDELLTIVKKLEKN